ncbi:MAG: copper resistance protein CopC [Methylococcales bacterium]|nr:copper resistance protein CopC [Methylococcales bacterium]
MQFRYSKLRVLFVTVILCLLYQNAGAEGILMQTQPRDNEALSAFDGHVKLGFSGNVSERTPTLVVVDSQGTRVDNSDIKLLIADRSELSVTTRPLTSGKYVIRYRVLTDDGLVVSGISRFSIK